MKSYQLAIVLPDSGEAKVKKQFSELEKLISSSGGKVTKTHEWGKRDLAYKIKKQKTGVYYFLEVDLPEDRAAVVNRELTVDEEVLRHLLVVSEGNKGTSGSDAAVAGRVKSEEKKSNAKKEAKTKKVTPVQEQSSVRGKAKKNGK